MRIANLRPTTLFSEYSKGVQLLREKVKAGATSKRVEEEAKKISVARTAVRLIGDVQHRGCFLFNPVAASTLAALPDGSQYMEIVSSFDAAFTSQGLTRLLSPLDSPVNVSKPKADQSGLLAFEYDVDDSNALAAWEERRQRIEEWEKAALANGTLSSCPQSLEMVRRGLRQLDALGLAYGL